MLDHEESEKEIIKQKEERKRKRDREISDIKKLLEIPEARRFLWRVLTEAKIHSSCFAENQNTMSYLEGRRDIGLFVLSEVTTANKNGFAKIQNEYFSELGKNKGSR